MDDQDRELAIKHINHYLGLYRMYTRQGQTASASACWSLFRETAKRYGITADETKYPKLAAELLK